MPRPWGLQALVLAQGHLREHSYGSLEGEALLAHVQKLHLGIAHHLQLLLLHGLLVGVGQGDVHRLLIEHLGAEHGLDHLPGGLAGAEAGDADLAALLFIGLLNSGLKIGCAHLHGQRDHAFL